MSQIRVNYSQEVEAKVNQLINLKFQAAYTCTSMACYFDRDDIAFPGFSKLFRYLSKRVNLSAKFLMRFQNSRGGRVVLADVKKPERDEWGTPLEALNICLNIWKNRMSVCQDLVKLAVTQNDSLTVKHINEIHLVGIVECIKHIGESLCILKKLPAGSEYSYDKTIEREIIRRMWELEQWIIEQHLSHHSRLGGEVVYPRSSFLTSHLLEKYDH